MTHSFFFLYMFTCCEGWGRGHIPSPAPGGQRTTFQIGSFFPPRGSQVLNPGSQDWPQVFPTRWDISPAPDDMCCCILWHTQSSITFWVMNFSASFWISWSLPHLFILLKEKLEISWLTVSSLFWWLWGGLECMWILDQGVLFRSASEKHPMICLSQYQKVLCPAANGGHNQWSSSAVRPVNHNYN